MPAKVFLKIFMGFIANPSVFLIAYTGNILMYEEVYGKTIASIVPLGATSLKEKSQRLFPGWSPIKKFILVL